MPKKLGVSQDLIQSDFSGLGLAGRCGQDSLCQFFRRCRNGSLQLHDVILDWSPTLGRFLFGCRRLWLRHRFGLIIVFNIGNPISLITMLVIPITSIGPSFAIGMVFILQVPIPSSFHPVVEFLAVRPEN